MTLKVILPFIIICFSFSNIYAQTDSKVTALVEAVHENDIAQRLNFINEIKRFENNNKAVDTLALKNELYKELAGVYNEVFNLKETEALLAFYKSPLGKKVLDNNTSLNTKLFQTLNEWEMKQQGIEIEAPPIPDFENEQFIENDSILNTIANQQKKSFPKINTLDDIKKLALEDPMLITNPDLLIALIGKEAFEKIHNPELLLEEPANGNLKNKEPKE